MLNIFIKLFWFLVLLLYSSPIASQEIKIKDFRLKAYNFIEEHKYHQTFKLLDSVLEIAISKRLKKVEAMVYNIYGVAYLELYDIKKAEIYHIKSMEINKAINNNSGLLVDYSHLSQVYFLGENHNKFDSLLPIAIRFVSKKKDISLFSFYRIEMNSLFNKKLFNETISVSKKAIQDLNDPKNASFFESKAGKRSFKRSLAFFEMYLAFSLMETNKNQEQANQLLSGLLSADIEKFMWRNIELYKNISKIYFYKLKYFTEVKPVYDSAQYYSKKSRSYNLITMDMLKLKSRINSGFIVDKISAEKEVERFKIINEQETLKRKNADTISTLAIFIGFMSLIAVYFVNRSKNYRKTVNSFLLNKHKKQLVLDDERHQFFSVITHQLRTPIYSIIRLSKMIQTEKDPEINKKHMLTFESSSNQLNSIIENALHFTKFNAGDFVLMPQDVDIVEVIDSIFGSLEFSAKHHRTTLHKDLSKLNSKIIFIDRKVIFLILHNLISNAIKFSDQGEVWIIIEEKASINPLRVKILFSIKDKGVGIPLEMHQAIFNKSESILDANNPNKGIGLGLRLTKKLLALYKSGMRLKSSEGKGSTFSFLLNLEKALSVNNISDTLLKESKHDIR